MSVRLHDLLARSADRWPDRYAVATADGAERLTYRELEERASSMREALARHGVGPGDRVAVYAPKSPASFSAILGILQTGAAYVPVDASAPPARAAYVIENCGVAAVVAAAGMLPPLREAGSADLRFLYAPTLTAHDNLFRVLSDVLCEVGVTDAARWAGKAIHDQADDQVQ